MKRFLSIVAMFVIFWMTNTSAMAEECSLANEFRIIKDESQWAILFRGKTVSVIQKKELSDIFGGKSPDTTCDHQQITPEAFAFKVGWQHDLFLAYGIKRNASKEVVGLQKVTYFPHDAEIDLKGIPNNQFTIKFGNKRDLNLRVCWNPKGDQSWWHSRPPRGAGDPPPGCDSQVKWAEWSVTDIPIN